MFRRVLPLTALAALLAFAPVSFSAEGAGPLVRVRVEGKTLTIFGPTQPRARAQTALDALEVASNAGEFYYHVQDGGFGPYVDQIGRYPGSGSSGWVFKVNGVSPPVGADKVELKAGDIVLWYWATFTDAGGPSTLLLVSPRRNCYEVHAQNDLGERIPVTAVVRYDGLDVRTKALTRACIGPHRGLVRATAVGTVRSNALP